MRRKRRAANSSRTVRLAGPLPDGRGFWAGPYRIELFSTFSVFVEMVKFLLWCILLVLCWPLALLALILYPLVWILLLPFRIVGIAVGGVFDLLWALVTLPARLLRA